MLFLNIFFKKCNKNKQILELPTFCLLLLLFKGEKPFRHHRLIKQADGRHYGTYLTQQSLSCLVGNVQLVLLNQTTGLNQQGKIV